MSASVSNNKQRPNNISIGINDISHTYKGGMQVLSNIDLEIGVGLFGLLGANGAGKSTLMRIICTLLEPSHGSVTINGFDVVKDRQEARKLIGYVPQEFGAWPTQSIENVMEILASLSGLTNKKERKQKIEEVLHSVGLGEISRRKVKKLSGGMLRRLGVAQALVHEPKILVMDEPTVGLDPEERLRFRQLMSELGRDRVIVLSTHIVADLGSSCSDIALIHGGRLEFRGSPADLIDQAKGKVFEVAVSPEVIKELEDRESFEIVAQVFRDGKSILRGVDSTGVPTRDAFPAESITLEEAYLAFTLNKGRAMDDEFS